MASTGILQTAINTLVANNTQYFDVFGALLNRCFNKAGLVIAGTPNATQYTKIANQVDYCVNGNTYRKATTDNIVWVTGSIKRGNLKPVNGSRGTGYVVGDVLTLSTGGTNGTVKVLAVDFGTGAVAQVMLLTSGFSYAAGNSATTGGTGSGAQINIPAVEAYAAQGNSTYCNYLMSLDTGGNVVVTQGPITTASGSLLPDIPLGQAPVGYITVACSGAQTFTVGTSTINSGNTATYTDVSSVVTNY